MQKERGGSPVHRRQWVVATEPHPVRPDWLALGLGGGLWLSHCPLLPVRVFGPEGAPAVLLGYAHPSDGRPIATDAATAADAAAPQGIADAAYGWGGRWVFIQGGPGGWLLPDPVNLANVHHLRDPRGGGPLVSGSAAVLRAIRPELKPWQRRVGWYCLNWFPTPGSRLEGVDKLLPDQALHLNTGRLARVARCRPDTLAGLDADGLGARLLDALGAVLRDMAAGGGRPVVALTAGLDSRTLLAAGLAAGLEVRTTIQAHPFIPRADLEVPQLIASRLRLRHDEVAWGPRACPRRLRAFDAHGLRAHADIDRQFYARGMFAHLGAGDMLLRGGGFEMARGAWEERLDGLCWQSAADDPALIADRLKASSVRNLMGWQFGRWLDWAGAAPDPRMSLGEHFHRDQRLAGWLAAAEQATDLVDAGTLNPFNSAHIHDILLSLPREQGRCGGAVQHAAIRLAGLGLEDVPVNPKGGDADRQRARRGMRAEKVRRLLDAALNWWPDRRLGRRLREAPVVMGGRQSHGVAAGVAAESAAD